MIKADQICNHIIHLIHMPIHVYDADGVRTAVYIDHGEQQDVLDCDEELVKMLLGKGREDYPVFYLELRQIIYGIVKGQEETYVIGPCGVGRTKTEAVEYLIKTHHMNPRLPYKVFGVSLDTFCEMAMMLYETVTDQSISKEELLQKNFCDRQLLDSMQEKLYKVFYELRENNAVHNPYSQEEREQEAIRKGDLDALNASFEEAYVGQLGKLSNDPLRQAKNITIVIITLASRSAIAGGLLPEIAYSMSDAFIQHAEELRDVAEVYVFGRQAEMEYCRAVRDLKTKTNRNPLITRCKGVVHSQLQIKLSVKDIAARLGITPGYLSHLFLEEEDIRLTDYIIREKIEASKRQLIYTDKSLDAVAYDFGFVSQSHFGQAFKKWTGMTPKQYRESNKIERKKYS